MKPLAWDTGRFNLMPLIGILRGLEPAMVEPIVLALANGGLVAAEITMNSPDACRQLELAIGAAGDRLLIGAGTVTNLLELDRAQAAGAAFIVTPAIVPEVIAECVSRSLPVFPGAYTPSEILQAHRLGATMVKLFPANRLGPGYLRDLRGPFRTIPLLATGGITPEVIPEYVAAGATGFGLGSQLLLAERVRSGDWKWVQAQAARFCAAWLQTKHA